MLVAHIGIVYLHEPVYHYYQRRHSLAERPAGVSQFGGSRARGRARAATPTHHTHDTALEAVRPRRELYRVLYRVRVARREMQHDRRVRVSRDLVAYPPHLPRRPGHADKRTCAKSTTHARRYVSAAPSSVGGDRLTGSKSRVRASCTPSLTNGRCSASKHATRTSIRGLG